MVSRLMILAAVSMVPATSSMPTLAQSQAPSLNPNEKVCESLTMVGSRLAKKRVCATRAEWEERKRQDRQAVDQIQKQVAGPCSVVANKNTGAISC